ncbi:MAG: hypothetical protein EAX90_12075 [Candidatus Heimdallarchaeota archaeon]|nr:hypothetical protein [Candidatus Heimdallarchaeota archaeon]
MPKCIFSKIRESQEYRSLGREWLELLREYHNFPANERSLTKKIDFYYSSAADENLQKLRERYELDKIAGDGSELNKIINLMTWVYSLTTHANEPAIPTERNAFSFIHMATVENKSINCYMKTVILNEVYLSMGFFSRHTHLLPHSKEEEASHYVTSVFSHTLGKWILMDPDFGVYVKDKKGNILGVSDIRKGLIDGKSMRVVHTGRSFWERIKIAKENFMTKIDYFWFLSEHIFKIRCPKISKFNQDSDAIKECYELLPENYKNELLFTSQLTKNGRKILFINNEREFWQEPKK